MYKSGFYVGDRIYIIPCPYEERKYNAHISLRIGSRGTVVEPPNEDFPDDAVQVQMDNGGCGALDSCILLRLKDEN